MQPDMPSREQVVAKRRADARQDALDALDAPTRLDSSAQALEDAPASAEVLFPRR